MSKLRICPACEFYKRGGKSRIAMKHTCGKHPVATEFKTVRIPKVDRDALIDVYINRTGIVDTGKAYKLTTKKQVIEGVDIPAGHEFWTPQCVIAHEFSSNPIAHVPGYVVNDILRFFVIKKLRDGC